MTIEEYVEIPGVDDIMTKVYVWTTRDLCAGRPVRLSKGWLFALEKDQTVKGRVETPRNELCAAIQLVPRSSSRVTRYCKPLGARPRRSKSVTLLSQSDTLSPPMRPYVRVVLLMILVCVCAPIFSDGSTTHSCFMSSSSHLSCYAGCVDAKPLKPTVLLLLYPFADPGGMRWDGYEGSTCRCFSGPALKT